MQKFLDSFGELLAPTVWEMEIIPSYSLTHILIMVIGFTVCGLIAWRLKGISDRADRIMTLCFGIFLSLCEIYKQAMYELVLEPNDGYHWRNLSFQLCSIPMYLFLIIPFLKEGRLKRAFCTFIMTYNLLGGFIAFFEPSGLFKGYVTLTLHAVIWHMFLVMMGLYLFFSHRAGLDKQAYVDATKVFLVLCAIAFTINCVFYEASGHEINMFFLGPGEPTIAVFTQIYKWFGWVVTTALYIPVVCLGAYIFLLIYRYVDKKLAEKKDKTPIMSA